MAMSSTIAWCGSASMTASISATSSSGGLIVIASSWLRHWPSEHHAEDLGVAPLGSTRRVVGSAALDEAVADLTGLRSTNDPYRRWQLLSTVLDRVYRMDEWLGKAHGAPYTTARDSDAGG